MKILVIRFSSIGDIVLTTPVVRCLSTQTNAEIHYLTKPQFASILKANPYISKVHVLEEDLKKTCEGLKKENFDKIIDLHKNLRTLRIRNRLNVNTSVFDKLNWKKWLLVKFKIKRMPDVHIVDRYLAAVRPLGVENDKKGLDYFLTAEDKASHLNLPTSYLAYGVGAAHNTKVLPVSKVVEVLKEMKIPVVLLGGPGDQDRANEITRALEDKEMINTCGELSLGQSAWVVSRATCVLMHDTGLMHIAAAFRRKIISVWGNTVPELGMYPYLPEGEGKSVIVENKELSCRPCSKIGYDACPKKHFNCMNQLDTSLIAEKIHENL